MIYTAMTGARQAMQRQSVNASNLSNVDTNGFKGHLSAARAVPVQGGGLATRTITAETTPGTDMAAGKMQQTDRPLDVAIRGDGWLAVNGPDGEAYTRNGDLQMDDNGRLTIQGNPVLDENGQDIVLPINAQLSVANDGTISSIPPGGAANTMAPVARLKLAETPEAGMQRQDNGLFVPKPKAENEVPDLDASEDVRIRSGVVESSNVSAIESMMTMIESARSFEMNMKGIQGADENAQRANELLNVS